MLLVAVKTLDHHVEPPTRTPLLEKLQEKGLMALVRAARLHAYELALLDEGRAGEMERALAADTDADAPYVRGDLFCFEDFVHFLVFGEEDGEGTGLRAGIVYAADTPDPQGKLEAFCRNVTDALEAARGFSDPKAASALSEVEWQAQATAAPESFTRFVAEGEGAAGNARGALPAEWQRVAGMLENTEARQILRRLVEAQREGRTGAGLVGLEAEGVAESLLERLASVGLVKREVLVSCRKDGRSLFRLPSPDALHVLNASNAICTECGAAIADEKADEITVPTPLTTTLLQDGSWLTTHLRSTLDKLGVPEAQIATRNGAGAGEARALAHLCGAAFLFLMRDGDWTTADARRAIDEQARTDAPHLVIVATGKIQEEARQRLREHARRRAHGHAGTDVLFIEGMDAVAPELRQAFERAAQAALNDELWPLDATIGLNVAQLVATRFRLLHRTGALRELAASAAGALAGSLEV